MYLQATRDTDINPGNCREFSNTIYCNFLSRARRNILDREMRDNNNSCLNWMSATSSQVPLQRMSDSKYLEIAVTPTLDAVSLSNENPTTLSCNLALLLEQIFDAANTLNVHNTHKRLRFDSPQLCKRLIL